MVLINFDEFYQLNASKKNFALEFFLFNLYLTFSSSFFDVRFDFLTIVAFSVACRVAEIMLPLSFPQSFYVYPYSCIPAVR